jgi:hypothetical protein
VCCCSLAKIMQSVYYIHMCIISTEGRPA